MNWLSSGEDRDHDARGEQTFSAQALCLLFGGLRHPDDRGEDDGL